MNAKLTQIIPVKTYKTPETATKAVEKLFTGITTYQTKSLRYFIMPHTDGRFFPVFIGAECLQFGVQFHFNVIG